MSLEPPAGLDRLGVAAALATGLQVGAALVATRFVVDQTGPGSLAFLRYVVGLACLAPAFLLARKVPFAGRDLLPIALLGVVQFGLLIALLNYALLHIPAARAALLFATFPLITLLIAAALGRETLTARKLSGVALTLVGVAVALGAGLWAPGGDEEAWLGAAAALAAAFCGALCSVLYRPYVARYPTLQVSTLAMAGAVVFLALLAAHEGFFAGPPSFTPVGWSAIGFIGLSSGIGYFLWLFALSRVPATQVAVFLSLSPPTAALGGSLLLGEPFTLELALGLTLVVAGLVVALWRPD